MVVEKMVKLNDNVVVVLGIVLLGLVLFVGVYIPQTNNPTVTGLATKSSSTIDVGVVTTADKAPFEDLKSTYTLLIKDDRGRVLGERNGLVTGEIYKIDTLEYSEKGRDGSLGVANVEVVFESVPKGYNKPKGIVTRSVRGGTDKYIVYQKLEMFESK
ncbi:MAG: hypothetical protein AABW49_00020 [Nanoarchaeota archaeon]